MTRSPYYNVQLGKKSTIQPLNMSISKLFQNALDIEVSQFLFWIIVIVSYNLVLTVLVKSSYLMTESKMLLITTTCYKLNFNVHICVYCDIVIM